MRFRALILLLTFVNTGCLKSDGGFSDLVSGSVDEINELVIETVLPDVTQVIIQQGQTQSFFATARAPIGRTVSYEWLYGSTVVSATSAYSIVADMTNVGTKTLILTVTDGVSTKTREWSVKVNGPPTITAVTTGTPKVSVGSDINIVATATDPNNDTLTYTWKLNGVASTHLVGTTGTAVLTGHSDIVGSMNISLEVSDGSASVSTTWTAEVNHFPNECNNLTQGKICTVSGSPSIGDSTQPGISTVDLKIKPISHTQDALGNIFVADWQSNVIWYWNRTANSVNRLGVTIPAQTIKVVAGTGEAATGPDGNALESALNGPRSVFYHEATSKLYIAEYSSSRVRYVDNTGNIYTGMGGGASNVDGATAYSHVCSNAAGLAYYNDSIYVTCRNGHRVKRWDLSTDLAYTVLGNGGAGFANGGATAVAAGRPYSVFVNSMGIFVSHNEIHRISFTNHSGSPITFWTGGGTVTVADGNVAAIVGTGSAGTSTNVNATAGNVGNPTGLVYLNNSLFFTALDGEYLYAVNNTGSSYTVDGVTVAAGKLVRLNAGGTYNGSGVPIASSRLYDPYDLSIDVLNSTTDLLISDYSNNRIRRVSLATEKLTDVLGSGKVRSGFYGDTSKPTMEHLFTYITGLTYDDAARKLFFIDADNYRLRATDAFGRTETALSRGAGDPTIDNDVPSNSFLRVNLSANWYMSGLGMLPNKSLLITNSGSANNIRLWNRSGAAATIFNVFLQDDRVSNLAGSYLAGGIAGDGPALTVALTSPTSTRYNPVDGKIYIVDHRAHCIRSLASDGTLTRVLGTCGTSGDSTNEIADTSLLMNLPTDIAFDSHGNAVISDRGNHKIRYWNMSASAVTVGSVTVNPNRVATISCLNGTGAAGSLNDGILATSARCNNPMGVAVNSSNICYANFSYHNVRCISLTAGATYGRLYTKAGAPPNSFRAGSPYGFEQEGIDGSNAKLYNPTAITFDANGDLYIADTYNHIVRKVKLSAD